MANTTQAALAAVILAQVQATMITNLRAKLVFGAYTEPGTIDRGHGTLIFGQIPDLTESTSTLSDDGINPTAEAMTLTTVTVTPSEIGRVISITRRAKALSPYDLIMKAANLLSFEALRRVDTIIGTAASASGIARYSGTALSRVTTSANITSADVRKWNTKLRSVNAIPFEDGTFKAIVHPFVSGDLQAESGGVGGSWVDSNRYADPEQLKRGEVGKLFNTSFMESTHTVLQAAAGAGAVDIYTTDVLGQGAIGSGKVEDITATFVDDTPDKADALGRSVLVGFRLDMGATALQSNAYCRFESAATSL